MELKETSKRERAIVVGVLTDRGERAQAEEYLEELILLADTAGAEVCHKITQERSGINPATFIGSGKAEEIGALVGEENIDLVIFDDDLSSVQVRNLEKIIKCKIVDRSGLILDIFASRARTKEAMTQVELAQLQYTLPRLTRQWTHLSKQYGGIGTKGPGEQQIEVDRRAIRKRIGMLKEKIERIDKERVVQRKNRGDFTRVALVGYTNAGKSTLFKLFSGAEVLVEDRLFATLDTTVRHVALSPTRGILLSDTVGFIRKLPSHLIASFKSTLSETIEADILLHVVDVSHPRYEEQIQVVRSTLEDLKASDKPTITVFNKIDRLNDRSVLAALSKTYEPSVSISATRSINIGSLTSKLLELAEHDALEQTIRVKQSDYRTIAKLHDIAEILEERYEKNNVVVKFRVSSKNMERLKILFGEDKGSKITIL